MVEASIIIPTFNRNESVNACVKSILSCELDNVEIIIVNDYKAGKVILNEGNKSTLITLVNNPKQGVASARNYGAKISKTQNLIFIDDDMIVNKEAILSGINFLNTTEKSTYNANWVYENELLNLISKTQFGRYLIKYNFTSLKGWNGNSVHWKNNTLIKAEGITSQFFAVKKNDFELVGGYNENFPFAGFEDYELNIKFKKLNIINYIDTRVLIYHNEIDRLNPKSWLNRQRRGAQTRKVAIDMGFFELKIKYNFIKKIFYSFLSTLKPFLMMFLKIIPNKNSFDVIYFRLINVLSGINIYEGYHSVK